MARDDSPPEPQVPGRTFTYRRWQELSPLLDEALDLPPEGREAWIEALRAREPEHAADLELLLAEHDSLDARGFLANGLPSMARPAGLSGLAGHTFGPYTLREEIGLGGMGSVWLADRSDGHFKGRVAVKLLNASHLGRQGEARFRREGSILARLRHPHIAHLVDAGISGSGQPYLVLEHVEGRWIDAYCDERALDVDARIRLFLDVLEAVSHAHAHLVVHRDIKPSNVLVSDDGTVKLLDFGIAKLLESETSEPSTALTRDGEAMLTPDYAAPEQLMGTEVTTRTDVYALGVLLYLLLSGRHPARTAASTPADLVRAVIEKDPPRLSDTTGDTVKVGAVPVETLAERRGSTPRRLRAVLRGDLDNIVAKALKKDPSERYESVEAFAADLRRFLAQKPVKARPDSLRYRTVKFVRRNRTAVALGAVAALALATGVAGTLLQARRARQEAARARVERARADQEAALANARRDFALREMARSESINEMNFLLLTEAPPGARFTVGELLERAEHLARRRGEDAAGTKAELLIQIADQYLNVDEIKRAETLLAEAHALGRSPQTRGRAACALADAISSAGDLDGARRLQDQALAELPATPEFAAVRAQCLYSASALAMQREDLDESLARAEEGQRVVAAAGMPLEQLQVDFSSLIARIYRLQGRLVESEELYRQTFAKIEAMGRAETDDGAGKLAAWSLALDALGRHVEAERLTRRCSEIAAAQTDQDRSPAVLIAEAYALRQLDRLAEARPLAERAVDMSRRLGHTVSLRRSLITLATIERRLGQDGRAARALDEIERTLDGQHAPQNLQSQIAGERAALAAARGDVEAAEVLANRSVATAEALGPKSAAIPLALLGRAEVRLAAGRAAQSLADADGALALWTASGRPDGLSAWQGHAQLARARALDALGRAQDARAAAAEAVRHLAPQAGPDHRATREARKRAGG